MKDALPLIWRRSKERYRLLGNRCQSCNQAYYPSRKICSKCRRASKHVPEEMPKKGKVISFTQVFSAPEGFENEAPYFLALIELDNGVIILSQIVDSPSERIVIGAPVKMIFRRVFEDGSQGALAYGFKFKVE